jgi:hypothetical protein
MSKIVKITESEIVDLVKKIVKEHKATTRRKTIKEDEYSGGGKFSITHAGSPITQIMITVGSNDDDDDGEDVSFTIEFDEKGNGVITDFFNYSDTIDDEEAKTYVQQMLAKGALRNAPDFISFDPETGEIHQY